MNISAYCGMGKFRAVLVLVSFLALSLTFLGMNRRGFSSSTKGELRAELRLRLYDEAIGHFEKAKAYHAAGQDEEALSEIRRALKVVKDFPEAYDLAKKIYLEQGLLPKAQEQENLFNHYGGKKGVSLYRLRDQVREEIEVRKKYAPPPDLEPVPSVVFSAVLAGFLLGGMIYEYRRVPGGPKETALEISIFLDRFPEEETEVTPSWLFKLLALLLPAPFLFSLLVLLGVRYSAELLPVFFFCWGIVAVAVYLIFFADLSDLGGFRRPTGGG